MCINLTIPTITVSDKLGDLQPLITFLISKPSKKRIRYAAISTSEVLDRVAPSGGSTGKYENWTFFNGIAANVTPARLRCFKSNLKCVCCGRVGNVFLLEKHVNEKGGQYINLYSATKHALTLMTVDHILPDCIGGKSTPSNFQTMCQPCNQAKQNVMPLNEINKVLADMDTYAKPWVNRDYLTLVLQTQRMYHASTGPTRNQFLNLFDKYRRSIKNTKKEDTEKHIDCTLRDFKRELTRLTYKSQIQQQSNWIVRT